MKPVIVAIGGNIKAYPYLYKLSNVLSNLTDNSVDYFYWDRGEKIAIDDGINKQPLLKFKPESKASLLFGYMVWIFKLFLFFSTRSKPSEIYFTSRLDTSLPFCIISLFKPSLKYIYLDRDAYHLTYDFFGFNFLIKKIETFVASRAFIHFVPGESRNFTNLSNVEIIRNSPNENFVKIAKIKAQKLERSKKYTLYINGWLVDARGSDMLLKLIPRLDHNKYKVIIAGPLDCENIKKLISYEIVEYYGQLDGVSALSIYYISDLVLAFYDPSIDINRKAEPNKWLDCIFTRTPFITNNGIETAKEFYDLGFCKFVDYNNVDELFCVIEALENKSISFNLTDEESVRNAGFEFWDKKVKEILIKSEVFE